MQSFTSYFNFPIYFTYSEYTQYQYDRSHVTCVCVTLRNNGIMINPPGESIWFIQRFMWVTTCKVTYTVLTEVHVFQKILLSINYVETLCFFKFRIQKLDSGFFHTFPVKSFPILQPQTSIPTGKIRYIYCSVSSYTPWELFTYYTYKLMYNVRIYTQGLSKTYGVKIIFLIVLGYTNPQSLLAYGMILTHTVTRRIKDTLIHLYVPLFQDLLYTELPPKNQER